MVNFWNNKKVLVTGDTGFKGSWLSCFLLKCGSEVKGVSLKPDNSNLLHNSLKEDLDFKSFYSKKLYTQNSLDIREINKIKDIVLEFKPDIVFHLAAQPLVRESYINPRITWETNVMGTVNLLEAVGNLKSCSVVIITTDKVYENQAKQKNYKEDDRLGGDDPYSSSKAAVELLVKSWRKSFYGDNIKISTARAGNVIGGGDWAKDRIVPDTVNSLIKNISLKIRYPEAVRPWQHVLDPLWGYMCLAKKQIKEQISYEYNFGPNLMDTVSVRKLVNNISKEWGKTIEIEKLENQPSESSYLTLSIRKAHDELNWAPRWDLDKTILETVKWYKDVNNGKSSYKCISENIDSFLLGK